MVGRYKVAALAAVAAGYGLFESVHVRLVRTEIPLVGLPVELDGLRIGHLADLHLGAVGGNGLALRRATDLLLPEEPDLICLSGDLCARARGESALRRALRELVAPLGTFAVLGNHDHGDGRDPFAERAPVDLDGTGVKLLVHERVEVQTRGRRLAIGGVDPLGFRYDSAYDLDPLTRGDADFGLLLSHFPSALDRIRLGAVDLILAGHLHGGQICVPFPGGKLRLSHPRYRYSEGVYGRDGTAMHISRGVGTTFVPIRFAASAEVTLLVLRAA